MNDCVKNKNDCKFCGRVGLPILPMRFAYVPGEFQFRETVGPLAEKEPATDFQPTANPLPGLDLNLGKQLTPQLKPKSKPKPKLSPLPGAMKGNPFPPVKSGQYLLRTITEGYIFIWQEGSPLMWTAYEVTNDGLFREIVLGEGDKAPDNKPPFFPCHTPGHKHEASLISIKEPEKKTKPIWVGYSRVWWTKKVRDKIVADGELRAQLMTPLDAKKLANGEAPDAKVGYRVDPKGEKISQHIQEYWRSGHAVAEEAFSFTHTVPVLDTINALNRSSHGEAAEAAKVMFQISAHGGIVLALRDPIGVVQDISAWRNQKVGEWAEFAHEHEREWTTANHITVLKKSMLSDTSEDSKAKEQWEKCEERLHFNKVQHALRFYETERAKVDGILAGIFEEWAQWCESPMFLAALKTYDPDNVRTLTKAQIDLAYCLNGAGMPKKCDEEATTPPALTREQEVLDKIIETDPTTGDYRLIKMAVLGNKDVAKLESILSAKDINDILSASVSVATTVVGKFEAWRIKHVPLGDRSSAAIIARTLMAQTQQQLARGKANAYRHLIVITFFSAFQLQVKLKVMPIEMTPAQYIDDIAQTTIQVEQAIVDQLKKTDRAYRSFDAAIKRLGQPIKKSKKKLSHKERVRLGEQQRETQANNKAAAEKASKKLAKETLALSRVQAMMGAATAVMPIDKTSKIKMIGLMPHIAEPRPPVTPAADPAKAAHIRKMGIGMGIARWMRHQKLDVAGTVFGSAFLIYYAKVSWDAYQRADLRGKEEEKTNSFTLFSSTVSTLISTVAFSMAAVDKARYFVRKSAEEQIPKSIFRLFGAFFSVASGFIDASYYWRMGYKNSQKGGSFGYHVAAGFTSIATGFAFAFFGLGFAALGIPVVGWLVIGIIMLALTFKLGLAALSEEAKEIEIWMSLCYFGKGLPDSGLVPYQSLAEEMNALEYAMCAPQVSLIWSDEPGRDRITLSVVFPAFNNSSELCYQVSVINTEKAKSVSDVEKAKSELVVFEVPSKMSKDPALRPKEYTPPIATAIPMPGFWEWQVQRIDSRIPVKSAAKAGWQIVRQAYRKSREELPAPVLDHGEKYFIFERYENYAVLYSEFLVNESEYDQVRLKFEYWPDQNKPEFCLMPGADNKVNFILEKD
jgi:ribosome-associated translation inhibitor RaiA